jgi:hypothetical protein
MDGTMNASREFSIEVDEPGVTAADMALSKNCADTLLKHYPNHLWGVRVAQGLIYVRNLRLSGRFGFILKMNDFYSATDLDKKLMQAGGEVLERYRMSREKMNADRTGDKLQALDTDFAGNVKFDQ